MIRDSYLGTVWLGDYSDLSFDIKGNAWLGRDARGKIRAIEVDDVTGIVSELGDNMSREEGA